MHRRHWKHVVFTQTNDRQVPKSSGVYALLHVKRVDRLPTATTVLYVGKSNNLRRRFRTHADRMQQHSDLLYKLILKHRESLEFWFMELPDKELDQTERELIKQISPEGNVILFSGEFDG